MNKRAWDGKYTITEKNDDFMVIECEYTCPYCGQKTSVLLTIYPESFALVEKGGFFEPLTCAHCSEKSDVMFG